MAGWVTGFAQGFSESVQAAIEKEQKSMDDLFKTQFSVRLNRRMDDLSKDRDDLADVSKRLKAYSGFTQDNLDQSAQLYNIGAGMGHDELLKRLSAIKREGGNPLEGVIWGQNNNVGMAETLDEYSRALIAPPTIAPVGPLQMGGGIIGAIQKQFGGAAEHSPTALRSAKRLAANLQSIAPIREASQYTIATPTFKEGHRFESEAEELARKVNEQTHRALKDRTDHLKMVYPHMEKEAIHRSVIAGEKANIAVLTRGDQLALSRSSVKVAEANASLAVLKLDVYETYGVDREQTALDLAKEQIKNYQNPDDVKKAITGVTYKLHQINNELDNPLTSSRRAKELERKREQLTMLQANFFVNQQRLEDMTATTSNRTRNLGTFIKMHADMVNAVFDTRTIGKKGQFVYLPDETGDTYRWTIKGDLSDTSNRAAMIEFNRLKDLAGFRFMQGITEGTNEDGSAKYVTDAAALAARTYVKRHVRLAWAQREHFKNVAPSVFVDIMREKGESEEIISSSLRNIYRNTKWQEDYKNYIATQVQTTQAQTTAGQIGGTP